MFGALQLAELGCDLDSLRFAARQRRRRLSQRQIAKAEAIQHVDLPPAPVPAAKKVTLSSTSMFSTSSIVLPRMVTSSVSVLNRGALQAPHVTSTSGMKCSWSR